MQYESKIQLGQLVQTIGTVLGVFCACIFAYAFLVGDVENAKAHIKENEATIKAEIERRERADNRMKQELYDTLHKEIEDVKELVGSLEQRQSIMLGHIRDDLTYLVRTRRKATPEEK